MNRKPDQLKKHPALRVRSGVFAVALTLSLLAVPITSYAGDINGNEQAVLDVVYGTFEYEGVTYKAAPSYISEAVAYLTRDDIDLTAEQRDYVISQIYANVKTGVENGYIIPVDGGQTTEGNGGSGSAQAGTKPSASGEGNGGASGQEAGETQQADSGQFVADPPAPTAPPETQPVKPEVVVKLEKIPQTMIFTPGEEAGTVAALGTLPVKALQIAAAVLVVLFVAGIAACMKADLFHHHRSVAKGKKKGRWQNV